MYSSHNISFCPSSLNFQSVGCDGYLNSTKYPDRCGVCGGDGSSCSLVFSEIISENLQVGKPLLLYLEQQKMSEL